MNTLMLNNNLSLKPFNRMAREIDRLFDVIDPFSSRSISYFSPQDWSIKNYEKEYKISVALPGIDKSNVSISSLKNKLTVSYENKEKNDNDFNYTSFTRSWQLPENVDETKIEAAYIDGILRITIPKIEPIPPTQIAIK